MVEHVYVYNHRAGRPLYHAELNPFAGVGRMVMSPYGLMLLAAALLALKAAIDTGETLENRTYTATWGSEEKTKLYEQSESDNRPDNDEDRRVCTQCGGTGMVKVYDVGMNYLRTEACRKCGGTGWISE